MKKILLTFAALATVAVTLPADARPGDHGGRGYGGHHGHRPPPPPHYRPNPPMHRPPPPVYRPAPPPPYYGHNPGYNRRPVLRYPYRTLAWPALISMFTYFSFPAPPPQMPWACFAQSNGYRGHGFGYNPQQAQENALLNCGPACMDGSYEINCGQRY